MWLVSLLDSVTMDKSLGKIHLELLMLKLVMRVRGRKSHSFGHCWRGREGVSERSRETDSLCFLGKLG